MYIAQPHISAGTPTDGLPRTY